MLVEQEVKKAVEKAKADLERRIPEIVAGITIYAMKHVNFRMGMDELTITVKMDGSAKSTEATSCPSVTVEPGSYGKIE